MNSILQMATATLATAPPDGAVNTPEMRCLDGLFPEGKNFWGISREFFPAVLIPY